MAVLVAFCMLMSNASMISAMAPVAEVFYYLGSETYAGADNIETELNNAIRAKLAAADVDPKYVSIMDAKSDRVSVTDPTFVHTGYSTWYSGDYPALVTPDYNHVQITDGTYTFYGYTEDAYKDFILTSGAPSGKKTITFDMDESKVDYHSMEGGGFLFNSKIDGQGNLSGYAILYGQYGIYVYKLENVNAQAFHNTRNARMGYGISGVTQVQYYPKTDTTQKHHSIKLIATNKSLNMWDNGAHVIQDLSLANVYGDEFGPLVSHDAHDCEVISIFTFENMKLYSTTDKTLGEAVEELDWGTYAPLRYVINVENNPTNFLDGGTKQAALKSELDSQNAQYIGVASSVYGTQTTDFIYDLIQPGLSVDTDVDPTGPKTAAQIVDEIATYIVGQILNPDFKKAIKDIERAEANTRIQFYGYEDRNTVKHNVTLVSDPDPMFTTDWSSDKPSIISNTGVVDRSSIELAGETVTLTATITEGTLTSEVVFTLIVLGPDPAPLTKLAATGGDGQVTLTFPPIFDATRFEIQQSKNGGSYVTVTPVETMTSSSRSATITGLTNGETYSYRIVVSGGRYNGTSNIVTAIPSAPVQSMTATTADSQVTLNFPALGNSANGSITIEISTDGETFTAVTPTTTIDGTSTSATIDGLINGTIYQFRLNVGAGAYTGISNVVTATPSVPITNLAATAGDGVATLSFLAPTGAGNGDVVVEISTDGTTFTPGATQETLSATSTSATVTGLSNGTTYYLRLNVGSGEHKGISNVVTAAPNGPVNSLAATAGNGQVTLSFPALTGATSSDIVIMSSTDGITFTAVTPMPELDAASTSATITGLTNGQTYYYRINVASGSFAGQSNTVSATPSIPMTVSAQAGNGQVVLSFPAPTGAGSGDLTVEISTDGTTFAPASTSETLSADSTSATVTGLTNGTKVYLRVKVASGAYIGTSNIVTATPSIPITSLAATAGNGQVALTFPAPSGAANGDVVVEISTDGTTFAPVSTTETLSATSTSATVTGLTNGTTYYLRLNIGSGEHYGFSNVVTAAPSQPLSSLTGTAGDGQVTLSFPALTGATSGNIIIEYTTDGGQTFTEVTPTTAMDATSTSATVTGLTNGQAYQFRLNVGSGVYQGVSNLINLYPSQPLTGVSATAGDGKVVLSFPAPTGAVSGDVVVEYSTNGTTFTRINPTETLDGTSTSATITGLSNGLTYYLRLNIGSGEHKGISNVVTAAPSRPLTSVTGTASDGQVTLSFPALTGATSSNIIIEYTTNGTDFTAVTPTNALDATSTSATVTGLTNGQAYQFRITVGSGVYKGVSNLVDLYPSQPIAGATAIAGDKQVVLNFPAATGAASGDVVVEISTDGTNFAPIGTTETLSATSTSATITGLTNGTTYYVRLNVGSGEHKGISNIITTAPSEQLTTLSGTASSGQVTLSFPALTGATSSNITIEYSTDGGQTFTAVTPTTALNATSTSATITGLTDGQAYQFRISIGSGVYKGVSNVIDLYPSQPITGVAATKGNGQVELTFPAPTGAGSGDVVVEVSTDGVNFTRANTTETLDATTTSATVTGLTNGTTYYLRLNIGSGEHKGLSNIVVTAPSEPLTTLSGTAGDGQVTLSFPRLNGVTAGDVVVEISTDGINYTTATPVNAIDANSTYATVKELTNGTIYHLRLSIASGQYAGQSNVVMVRPQPPTATEMISQVTVKDSSNGGKVVNDKITSLIGNNLPVTGKIISANGQVLNVPEVLMNQDGSFKIPQVAPGEYQLALTVYAPNGEKLAGPVGKLTVDSQGVAKIEVDLIDPYGIILDTVTKKPVVGVNMQLYWADTELNRSKGRVPGTLVPLPELPNFMPNKNHNPQISSSIGEYGWMVYADGDYYFLGEKDGYVVYDSRNDAREEYFGNDSFIKGGIIHVGETIVEFSFSTEPKLKSTGQHGAYLTGYPDRTFKPEDAVLRSEIAMILSRVFTSKAELERVAYADVSTNHWAIDVISIAVNNGWMVGDNKGKFNPNKQMTRAEFAQLLMNIYQWDVVEHSSYTDVAGHWAEKAIATVENQGLLVDFTGSTLNPNAPLKRGQVVRILNKLLDRNPWHVEIEPKWIDVPTTYEFYSDIMEASVDHRYDFYETGVEDWK